jgi:hypothetical protein
MVKVHELRHVVHRAAGRDREPELAAASGGLMLDRYQAAQ